MENTDLLSEMKDGVEMKDMAEMAQLVGAMAALQHQMNFPSYEGMIAALQNAQCLASPEIQGVIHQGGGQVCSKPWAAFTSDELYHMLPVYMDGLRQHGIKKCGEQLFKKILSENGLLK